MAELIRTPYTTVAGLASSLPSWINPYDAQRYAAYSVYDDMFDNVDGTYSLVSRGAENKPVYIPTARTVVKTLGRYTAVKPTLDIQGASDAVVADARLVFDQLFKRERFWSKFEGNKLLGMRRGDWLWHIVANPLKPQGSRISIYALDPRSYFKITSSNDIDRVLGCHIVDQIVEGDKTLLKKQTYTKGPDPTNKPDEDDGKIYYSCTIWEMAEWEDPKKSPVRVVVPPTALPDAITQLPVYHIPHNEEPGNPYGVSELQGLEKVMAEIIQSTSDESLALALEGLGMYATTSGPPRDEKTKEPIPWRLGPGRVVEHPTGTDFNRVDGIGSVAPYQDHLNFVLEHGIARPAGLTDASLGKVDASIAESGVALALQMAPTLSQTEKNDTTIKEIHDQFLFDLKSWFAAYEQTTIDESVLVQITFGSKLPINRKEVVQELFDMYDKGLIDSVYFRLKMGEFGYVFPEGMAFAVATERAQMLAAVADPNLADPDGARADAELSGAPDAP